MYMPTGRRIRYSGRPFRRRGQTFYPRGTFAAKKIQRAFRRRQYRRRMPARISTLERKVANNRQWGTYELDAGNTTLANGKWHIRTLVNPSNWTQQFQASNNLDSNQNVQLYSCNIQLFHRPTDSLIPLTMKFVTVYLVKLKRETALQTLEDTAYMSTPAGNTTGFNKSY